MMDKTDTSGNDKFRTIISRNETGAKNITNVNAVKIPIGADYEKSVEASGLGVFYETDDEKYLA